MNKWKLGIGAASLALILAACQDTAQPVDGEEGNTDSDSNSDESSNSELTLEEVFAKSIEAGEDVNSMKAEMTLDQDMTIPNEDLTVTTASDIQMDMVMEPLGLYQESVTTSDQMGETEEIQAEVYFTEEGFFMYDTASDQWMKLPTEMSDELLQMSDAQSNPNEQLRDLEQFTDDFTFEQDDSSYILTLNASGEKFSEFLREQAKEQMPDTGTDESMDELFSDVDFEDVMYKIFIDKETFLPSSLTMDMTMVMEMEGESLTLVQNTEANYLEYNHMDEITIPQEVLDTATEVQ
ncbi:DUF6612 family protein [Jeotgalibacillus proteolyticus]|uniref:Lipoprotein n=1 Tax=Jeotgalibacillus proteolyticus TaxID=2082395 RepID=A0A2S5GFR6_9BACL|nr:DUF6612 family protein [Jeotgalibacillus proteolyticus]PPA71744.1 hypothetical protein C4B60_06765 [Jeotgalibacillus proteolyticus]